MATEEENASLLVEEDLLRLSIEELTELCERRSVDTSRCRRKVQFVSRLLAPEEWPMGLASQQRREGETQVDGQETKADVSSSEVRQEHVSLVGARDTTGDGSEASREGSSRGRPQSKLSAWQLAFLEMQEKMQMARLEDERRWRMEEWRLRLEETRQREEAEEERRREEAKWRQHLEQERIEMQRQFGALTSQLLREASTKHLPLDEKDNIED